MQQLRLEERIRTGIDLGESHFREFKSGVERKGRHEEPRGHKEVARDIGEALIAFANADGGELLVGVEDNGRITGLPHSDKQLDVLREAFRTHVHPDTPLPMPSIRELELDGKLVLYFQVSKSSVCVHLTSDGRCLQRFDRENRPVPAERIQYERQEGISREYDRMFVDHATVNDLDLDLVDSVSQHIASGYSPEKLLQFLDLAEYTPQGLKLRRATLLLFAKNTVKWHPRCQVRILRIPGSNLAAGTDYSFEREDIVGGNICSLVEEAWDSLRPHLARTRLETDAVFRESFIYPEIACREALINAIAHRDYSSEGKPVEILIYDDHMEIRSPGELLSTMKVSELKALEGVHQSRNVFIARVLRELGYMREMGEGIRRIFTSIRDSDLVDPEIESSNGSFTIALYNESVFSPKDVRWLEGYKEFDLTRDEQRVVLMGRDHKLLSTAGIFELLKIVDTEDFRALYEQLNAKGIIHNPVGRPKKYKRSIPRFRVRPPREAQQYFRELIEALVKLGETSQFDATTGMRLQQHISKESPYFSTGPDQNPTRSLRALGFASSDKKPLPKLRNLWRATLGSGAGTKIEKLTEEKPEIKRPQKEPTDQELRRRIVARVNAIYETCCYAKDKQGQRYYLHRSSFERSEDWKKVGLLAEVSLELSERRVENKPPAGKRVRILKRAN